MIGSLEDSYTKFFLFYKFPTDLTSTCIQVIATCKQVNKSCLTFIHLASSADSPALIFPECVITLPRYTIFPQRFAFIFVNRTFFSKRWDFKNDWMSTRGHFIFLVWGRLGLRAFVMTIVCMINCYSGLSVSVKISYSTFLPFNYPNIYFSPKNLLLQRKPMEKNVFSNLSFDVLLIQSWRNESVNLATPIGTLCRRDFSQSTVNNPEKDSRSPCSLC